MSLIIRNVRPDDLNTVAAIESRCFPEGEAADRTALADRIQTMPQWFLVAEEDGRLVGLINGPATKLAYIQDALFAPGAHNPDGTTLAILGLAVDAPYQRRGIAARLLREYLRAARIGGMDRVVLTCKERLIPYYQKFGFVNQGISQSVHGGAVWYDMEIVL